MWWWLGVGVVILLLLILLSYLQDFIKVTVHITQIKLTFLNERMSVIFYYNISIIIILIKTIFHNSYLDLIFTLIIFNISLYFYINLLYYCSNWQTIPLFRVLFITKSSSR